MEPIYFATLMTEVSFSRKWWDIWIFGVFWRACRPSQSALTFLLC